MQDFETTIKSYHNEINEQPNHRFVFWEHCYRFFYANKEKLKSSNNEQLFDYAALILFAYLSSWGMLRASFLMDFDYKIHINLIKELGKNHSKLWDGIDNINWEDIKKADDLILNYYIKNNFKEKNKSKNVDDVSAVLRTKILLGIFGCTPAYDRFFKKGMKEYGFVQQFSQSSYTQLVDFYKQQKHLNIKLLDNKDDTQIYYPPMKLIDMYFWQIGYKKEQQEYKKDGRL